MGVHAGVFMKGVVGVSNLYIDLVINTVNTLALFSWSSFSIFVLMGITSQFYTTKASCRRKRKLEFVLVSVASHSVKNSLFESITHTKQYFPKYLLTILIDEGADLTYELLALEREGKLRVVITPKDYKNNLLAKGRAMHYFIENYTRGDFWYSFFDDDNLIMGNRFLYEIPYYEKRGYVVCNPILKPRSGRSTPAYIMDWIRYFDDLMIFRFFTGLMGKPILGLHGELLTVKGSVLREIGFNRYSYTEDFRFAGEIVGRGYKSWQTKTILSIKSPNSMRDLLKQRGRWFKGLVEDLRFVPWEMRIIVGWRLSLWILGIFGSWAFSFIWLAYSHPSILLIPGGLYYWAIYLYAVKRGGIKYFLLIPLFGIIECASFGFGLKAKSFVVIDKN